MLSYENKKKNIFLITGLIFVGQAFNYLVVKLNFSDYLQRVNPMGTPEVYFFDISWLAVYILMVFSALTLVVKNSSDEDNQLIYAFSSIIALNILMNIFFFVFDKYYAALFVNIVLIIALLVFEKSIWKKSKLAVLMLIPYLILIFLAALWLVLFIQVNAI